MQENRRPAEPAESLPTDPNNGEDRAARFRAEPVEPLPEEPSEEPHEELHGDADAEQSAREAEEQKRARLEERKRVEREASWKRFMQAERRDLRLRKDGQLEELLGEPLPGEPPEALLRLAHEDRRQAEQGLVALMSGGKLFYKPLVELSPEDMPARIAAGRLRTAWLKKRRDEWSARGEDSL